MSGGEIRCFKGLEERGLLVTNFCFPGTPVSKIAAFRPVVRRWHHPRDGGQMPVFFPIFGMEVNNPRV